MALHEKSEDHQSSYSSSWGEHERLNHISSPSIQQLFFFLPSNQLQPLVALKHVYDFSLKNFTSPPSDSESSSQPAFVHHVWPLTFLMKRQTGSCHSDVTVMSLWHQTSSRFNPFSKFFPSRLLGSFLPEHGRHASDDPSDAGRALPHRPALSDEVDQPVKHHQDAVIRLCCWHLEEAAALGQSEQPSLLTGDAAVTQKVPFVRHNDDGDGRWLPAATDLLQLLADHVEAAAVADTVDQDHPISPLQLFVSEGRTLGGVLRTKEKHFKLKTFHLIKLFYSKSQNPSITWEYLQVKCFQSCSSSDVHQTCCDQTDQLPQIHQFSSQLIHWASSSLRVWVWDFHNKCLISKILKLQIKTVGTTSSFYRETVQSKKKQHILWSRVFKTIKVFKITIIFRK